MGTTWESDRLVVAENFLPVSFLILEAGVCLWGDRVTPPPAVSLSISVSSYINGTLVSLSASSPGSLPCR